MVIAFATTACPGPPTATAPPPKVGSGRATGAAPFMLERLDCPLERGDCDGDARNGCETDLGDLHNCGRCAADCARPNMDSMCVGDRCRHRCSEGYCDADGDASNGCEAKAWQSWGEWTCLDPATTYD
ncbi:MAG: hypothetical protein HY908_19090 [Myxococcales bacterium]|nr:hypothetical protein [Myxococcales bacterium]